MTRGDIVGLRVTVMGLGLHGGGLSSARYFAERGAEVTVTDLRDARTLTPSVEKLDAASEKAIRYVLGRHEAADFEKADLIIKNPAVPLSSPFLKLALKNNVAIETDLSIFLSLNTSPLIAVTGSKGKSTTASALQHCLKACYPGTRLGGNITLSPLDFLDDLQAEDPVVLELSSWQLADLKGKDCLKPRIAVLTNILPDHQDHYPDMDSYRADKMVLFESLTPDGTALLNFQDPARQIFADATAARIHYFSAGPLPKEVPGAFLAGAEGWIKDGAEQQLLFSELRIAGVHNRSNMLAAGLAAVVFGCAPEAVRTGLEAFPGIEHRLEFVAQKKGLCFYNDSAATLPQSTLAALESIPRPITLIAGGTDKNLDFSALGPALEIPRCIVLLRGSATVKIQNLLHSRGISYQGPFDSLEDAFGCALQISPANTSVLFSPGCASFELFLNEFDRGRRFKDLIRAL